MTNTRSIDELPGEEGGGTATDALRGSLSDVIDVLNAVLGGLEPREVQLPQVTEIWKLFDQVRRLGASGSMLLSARVREADQWRREGFGSLAEWMAHQSGTSVGRARSELDTSERLRDLPDTADRLRRGALSPEQAEKVSDAARVNPEAERDLLERAEKDSLRELAEEAARRKAEAESEEAQARRIRRQRSVRHWVGKDGAFHLHATGPKSDGAVIAAMLDRLVGQRMRQEPGTGGVPSSKREGREALAFDALIDLARPSRSTSGTTGDSTSDGERGSSRSTDPTHLALVRVDLAALVRGSVGAGEVCEIPGIGPIAISEARALLGDSVLKLVLTNGVDVANVTHLGRGPSAAQKIALRWRGTTCSVEGCGRPARETDHRIDFSVTGHTRLDELDPLCGHDHDLKTYKGWALVEGTGVRPMVPPGHPDHPGTAAQQWARTHAPPGDAASDAPGSSAPPGPQGPAFDDGQLFALVE